MTGGDVPDKITQILETTKDQLFGWRYVQRIARSRSTKNLRVIAVTGTSDKTTTALYINEILKEAKFKTAVFTSSISEMKGVELPAGYRAGFRQFFKDAKKAEVDYLILTIDAKGLDQQRLAGVPIEAAVLTNLSDDRLAPGRSMDDYVNSITKLFKLSPRFIVLNRDDQYYEFFDKFIAGDHKMSYGTHPESEAHIDRIKLYRKGTEADVVFDHQTHLELATALPGEFNVMNMTAAVTLAYLLGVKLEDMQEGAANLEVVPGRFERVVEGQIFDVIVDEAHTPAALGKVLSAARDIAKGRVILVFGGRVEQGRERLMNMGEAAANGADRIFLTSEEGAAADVKKAMAHLREGIEKASGGGKMTGIDDRQQAIERAMGSAKKGDIVLITGLGDKKSRFVNGETQDWQDGEVARKNAESLPKAPARRNFIS